MVGHHSTRSTHAYHLRKSSCRKYPKCLSFKSVGLECLKSVENPSAELICVLEQGA